VSVEPLVAVLMSMNRIAHLPSVGKVKRLRGVVTADDLVNRKFHRPHPNELWVTDITEHPTREGKPLLLRCIRCVQWQELLVGQSTPFKTPTL
jgi:transposase InsO family protein